MKKLLLLPLLMLTLFFAKAQPARSFVFASSETAFVELPSPTIVGKKLMGDAFSGKIIQGDTGVTYLKPSTENPIIDGTSIPIGFNFPFKGTIMDHITIFTDGAIYFGKNKAPAAHSHTDPFNNSYLKNFIISQYSEKCKAYDGTQIGYQVQGNEGSKTMTIEFKNIMLKTKSEYYDTTSFQIILKQSGDFAIHYKKTPNTGTLPTTHFFIGFVGGTSSDFHARTNYISTNNYRPWTATTLRPTNYSTNVFFTNTVYPASDLLFSFNRPANCIAPTTAPTIKVNKLETYSLAGAVNLNTAADNALILFQEGEEALTVMPTNGTYYAPSSYAYKGDSLGKARVIAAGNLNFTVKDLTASTKYTIYVFPYNDMCTGGPVYATQATSKLITTGFMEPELQRVKRDSNSITLKSVANKVNSKVLVFESSDDVKFLLNEIEDPASLNLGDTVKVEQDAWPNPPIICFFTVVQKGDAGEFTVSGLKSNTPKYFTAWSYQEGEGVTFSTDANYQSDHTWSEIPAFFGADDWMNYNTQFKNANLLPAGWSNIIVNTGDDEPSNFRVSEIEGGMGGEIPKGLVTQHNKIRESEEDYQLILSDVISPGIHLKDGKFRVKFDVCFSNNTGFWGAPVGKPLTTGDTLFVQVSKDMVNFTTVGTIHKDNFTNLGLTLQTQGFRVDGFANNIVYVRFLFKSPNLIGANIKNLKMEQLLDCDYPVKVSVIADSIGAYSAKVNWENTNDEDPMLWNIRAYDVKKDTYLESMRSTNNPFWLGNLKSSTDYKVQVQAVCAANSMSLWSDLSNTFSTMNAIPYSEDWSDEGFVINNMLFKGWQNISKSFTGSITYLTAPEEPLAEGWHGLALKGDWDNNKPGLFFDSRKNGHWYVSPAIDLGSEAKNIELKFDLYTQADAEAEVLQDMRFWVLLSQDGGKSWNIKDTIYTYGKGSSRPFQSEDLLNNIASIKGYKGSINLAFFAENLTNGDNNSSLIIDKLSLNYTCIAPLNVMATPGEDTVLIEWTSSTTNAVVRYRTKGSETYEYVASSTGNVILKDIKPATAYEYSVQMACSIQDSSIWVNQTFNTLVPYVCDTVTAQRHSGLSKTSANIVWTSDAAKFTLLWKEVSANKWDTVKTTAKLVALTNLKPGTSYEYKIQAQCSADDDTDVSLWTASKRFGTLAVTCHTPTNFHFVSSTWQSVKYTWVSDAPNSIFALKRADEAIFSYYQIGQADTVILSNLSQNTMYVAKVAALCTVGDTSAWSEEVSASTINPVCNAPTTLSASAITSNSVDLSWKDANNQHQYGWTLVYKASTASKFDTVRYLTKTNHSLTNLNLNTAYVWKVQGHCDEILSSVFSTQSSFQTTHIEAVNDAKNFDVYAEKGQVHIRNLNNSTIVRVDVLNLNGQSLGAYALNTPNNVFIPLHISNNIVIVKITTQNKVFIYKIFNK